MLIKSRGIEVLQHDPIERFSLEVIRDAHHDGFYVGQGHIVIGMPPNVVDYRIIGWDATTNCLIGEQVTPVPDHTHDDGNHTEEGSASTPTEIVPDVPVG